MAFSKITSADLADKGVASLGDTPDIEASKLKERFDSLGNLAIERIKLLVSELEAQTGAVNTGAVVPTGLSASGNVQSIINAMYLLIKELKLASHQHTNGETIDLISTDFVDSVNKLERIFAAINAVDKSTVSDSEDRVPSSAAVLKYLKDLKNGTNGQDGKDGISPKIDVQQVDNGYRLVITDADGTQNVLIRNGEKGEDGTDGIDGHDGVSPVVNCYEKGNGVHELSITDAKGRNGFLIYDGKDGKDGVNGQDGAKGEKGDKGDKGDTGAQGEKGEDGADGREKKVTIGTYGRFTLEPNTFYHFTMDKLNGIAVELGTPTDDTAASEYHFMFNTYAKDDGTCGTILDLPETVKIPSDFTVEANKIYEVSILENCLAYQCWDK